MRYLILLAILSACASTPAEEHYWKAHNECEQHMWTVWDNSNHVATVGAVTPLPIGFGVISSVAIFAGGTLASGVISDSTAEHSKSGPVMTEHDREIVFQKCMKSRGFSE